MVQTSHVSQVVKFRPRQGGGCSVTELVGGGGELRAAHPNARSCALGVLPCDSWRSIVRSETPGELPWMGLWGPHPAGCLVGAWSRAAFLFWGTG